ncbi:Gmad2 immunoglobulin-like domain-containing protein [Micromonospora sp. WMMA1363]|uniref:Gmad2 immunoglobulin-like domain-containing protein n=1 Tax=Micromonospora sp. WMMA1363 TaxID=3053985 RepID=UPI00259D1108|nr:Gmad2 immunoglobulin-like domain-containing protein [Micromonospora sp. WMMA1363]MDM4719032.1 Gmad2 immunoglobulin-like domain-containing protein [Micromonospora sp. WMMA1363]
MRRGTRTVIVAVLLAVGGCAESRSGSLGPAPTAPPTAPGATTPSRTSPSQPPPTEPDPVATASAPIGRAAPTGTVTIELWYARDGRIAPTRRTRPATVATSRLALTELATGPTAAEAGTGLTTLVPAGVEVTRIADGTAVLPAVPATDGSAAVRLREAQVVWTLTQFPTVRRVRLGTADPVDRADYVDLLPPIVVTTPVIGTPVTSPVTVTGTADAYEATVSVRVLDGARREIATTFTTAACGSGCRGDYRVAVNYRVDREQAGTVEVYEVSAKDGSRTHTVAVPVLLTPSR